MERREPFDLYLRRDLRLPIPPVALPEGYTVCIATEENGKLWETVMDRAFGGYEPGDFRYVMVSNFGYEVDRVFLLCDEAGRPAATATSWWQPYKWGDPGIGEVLFVGVDPGRRGRGLARQMVNRILQDMVGRGMRTASISTQENNFSAVKTYLNCGFLSYIHKPEHIDVWDAQFRALGIPRPDYDRTLRVVPEVPHPAPPHPYALRMEKEAAAKGDAWVHGAWERHNMFRLDPQYFDAVAHLYGAIDGADIRLASIRAKGGGRVFTDRTLNPQASYMEGDDGYGYLAGSTDCGEFIDGVIVYLMHDAMRRRKPEDRQVILFSADETWKALLDLRLAPFNGLRIKRHTFAFDAGEFHQAAIRLPALPGGYEIMSRGGGRPDTGVFTGGEEVSYCKEVFSGAKKAEIDVFTAEGHRRRGLALHACAGFISNCLNAGVTPHWSCWDYNAPSASLAMKLGFRQLPDQEVNFCEALL